MDEIQAAVLNVRLPHLDQWNERRREIVRRYRLATSGTTFHFVSSPVSENACHLCVARHPNRDMVRRVFEDAGIATSVHYPLLDVEQQALSGVGYRSDELTESRKAQGEILTLPCFPQLTEAEIERVSQVIRSLD
jgi:dTDP-4-amino-4,6-dideoxygalactose transaminase